MFQKSVYTDVFIFVLLNSLLPLILGTRVWADDKIKHITNEINSSIIVNRILSARGMSRIFNVIAYVSPVIFRKMNNIKLSKPLYRKQKTFGIICLRDLWVAIARQ